MTAISAISPYAPPSRNSLLLRRSSSLSANPRLLRRSSSVSSASGNVAFLCLVVRYWDSPPIRRLRELLRIRQILESDAFRAVSNSRAGILVGAVADRIVSLAGWILRTARVVWTGLDLPSPPSLPRASPQILGGSGHCRGANIDEDGADNDPEYRGHGAGQDNNEGSGDRHGRRRAGPGTRGIGAVASIPTDEAVDCIRRNLRLIDSVLSYWFSQFSPEVSQKKLWMIASSSVELLREVDADITKKFRKLIMELAVGGKKGQGSMRDEWCHDAELYGWRGKLACIVALDQMARHIRRQIQGRHENLVTEGGSSTVDLQQLPPQSHLDSLALSAAQLLQSHHTSDLTSGTISTPMRIFALMPFRHASTLESVGYVQREVEKMAKLGSEVENMVRRFRRATNRRMAVLQDEARREGKSQGSAVMGARAGLTGSDEAADEEKGERQGTKTGDESADNNKTAAGGNGQVFEDEDILETLPFDADKSDAADHVVMKAMVEFLADEGIEPSDHQKESCEQSDKCRKLGKRGKTDKEWGDHRGDALQQRRSIDFSSAKTALYIRPSGGEQSKQQLQAQARRNVIVSLSGGVDSMVITHALSWLRSHLGYSRLNVATVHVDYGNRPESAAEASYVRRYAHSLGMECTVRRIEDVKRGETDREEYEKLSREVRYGLYRETAQKMVAQGNAALKQTDAASRDEYPMPQSQQPQQVGVMLGHHRGDLRENVLSNAHRGSGPLDLSGMTATSLNDRVLLYRPFLALEKSSIFDYAHKYGVPYFKDTTPHWSTRGKLRNRLLPLLEEIYGDGSMSNLTKLAEESDSVRSLVRCSILQPFLDGVEHHPMGISFDTAAYRTQPVYFWKLALREALHSAGRGMFGDGSLGSFVERVDPTPQSGGVAGEVRAGWLQMRRDYAVYLRSDGRVYVFHPESFPWRKADQYLCVGNELGYGMNSRVEVGPWTITADVLAPPAGGEAQVQKLLEQRAVPSWESLMAGFVRYHLRAPLCVATGLCRPLLFMSEFRRGTRPLAWKNSLDLRVEATLPLPGLDEEAQSLLEGMGEDALYGKDWCMVQVSLVRDGSKSPLQKDDEAADYGLSGG